jgi:hypothetical protein
VQAGVPGAWTAAFRFRSDVANAPPVIESITASPRAEAKTELTVTVVAQDQETGPANLIYEWSSTGGSFTGTGASVRWLAPAISAPTAFQLTVAVIERYTTAAAGGGIETRENRVTATTTVHANDSSPEVTGLATTFIDDFIHTERSPEFCVRNFSDSCAGKQDELQDIRENRRQFVINPGLSSLGAGTIHFFDIADPVRQVPVAPSQAGAAEFLAPCRFAATTLGSGVFGVAVGTCRLTTVYENWQWRLCVSNFLPAAGASPFSIRFHR